MEPLSDAERIDAEGRHASALVSIFERYGVPIPPDTWPGRVPRYVSLQDACEAAVAAEIANAELYDRVLAGTDRDDILRVYRNLQEASQERHLPAFRRCAERGPDNSADPDQGSGGQRRRRRRHRGGE